MERTLNAVVALLEAGSLPRSACGKALVGFLQPLLDAGVLVEERSGAGRRLVVKNTGALRKFVSRQFPDASAFAGASSRIDAVARFRDTKALPNDVPEVVLTRVWAPGALRREGELVAAGEATARHGVFAFRLEPGSSYSVHGPCALVENPALFAVFERTNIPVGAVFYGHGRASSKLIEWFRNQTAADFTLLHLPDYDPVGLSEFERFRVALGTRVQLHIPPDFDKRFRRYSNPRLLQNPHSQALLAQLRIQCSPEVQPILNLIGQTNACLEQEALLLSALPPPIFWVRRPPPDAVSSTDDI